MPMTDEQAGQLGLSAQHVRTVEACEKIIDNAMVTFKKDVATANTVASNVHAAFEAFKKSVTADITKLNTDLTTTMKTVVDTLRKDVDTLRKDVDTLKTPK